MNCAPFEPTRIELNSSGYLGVPSRVTSNSQRILEAIEERCQSWMQTEVCLGGPPSIQMDFLVCEEASDLPEQNQAWTYHLDAEFFRAWGKGCEILAWPQKGQGQARLRPEVLESPSLLQNDVLDCLGLFLASFQNRLPLHCLAIAWKGQVLLLLGPPGVGKSTLAYACIGQGLQVLTDEAVYLERGAPSRLWLERSCLRLSPSLSHFFPELDGQVPQVFPGGKVKLSLEIPQWEGFFKACSLQVALLDKPQQPGPVFHAGVWSSELLEQLSPGGFSPHRKRTADFLQEAWQNGLRCFSPGSSPKQAAQWLSRELPSLFSETSPPGETAGLFEADQPC